MRFSRYTALAFLIVAVSASIVVYQRQELRGAVVINENAGLNVGVTDECGVNTCMSAGNCAFFGGTCAGICGEGCCCAAAGSVVSDAVIVDDVQPTVAMIGDACEQPPLVFDCDVCPGGVAQRFALTAEGSAGETSGGCAAYGDCTEQVGELFLEYRGDCQWSTDESGETCDALPAPEWTLTLFSADDDAQTVTLFERDGAIYSGWTTACAFPVDFVTTRASQACLGATPHIDVRPSCEVEEVDAPSAEGQTIDGTGFFCGDALCRGDESPLSCPRDCPSPCGDGICSATENSALCADDCRCGDFVCSADENGSTCPNDCSPSCGNGIVEADEQCDDGIYNSANAPDGCRTNCRLPVCGDGVTDSDEVCDDGNRVTDDRCANDCLIGLEGECADDAACASELCTDGTCRKKNVCGNGVREGREVCDDGNANDDDDCTRRCMPGATCGDGIVDARLGEECDQGMANSNTVPNRCSEKCMLPRMGNGVIDRGEQCDDGNEFDGDGCSAIGVNESVSTEPIVINPSPVVIAPAETESPFAANIFAPHGGAPLMSLNNSGPAALVLMVTGASAGYALLRRKRR